MPIPANASPGGRRPLVLTALGVLVLGAAAFFVARGLRGDPPQAVSAARVTGESRPRLSPAAPGAGMASPERPSMAWTGAPGDSTPARLQVPIVPSPTQALLRQEPQAGKRIVQGAQKLVIGAAQRCKEVVPEDHPYSRVRFHADLDAGGSRLALNDVRIEVQSGAPLDPAVDACLRQQTAQGLSAESSFGAHPSLQDGFEYFVIFGASKAPAAAAGGPPSTATTSPKGGQP